MVTQSRYNSSATMSWSLQRAHPGRVAELGGPTILAHGTLRGMGCCHIVSTCVTLRPRHRYEGTQLCDDHQGSSTRDSGVQDTPEASHVVGAKTDTGRAHAEAAMSKLSGIPGSTSSRSVRSSNVSASAPVRMQPPFPGIGVGGSADLREGLPPPPPVPPGHSLPRYACGAQCPRCARPIKVRRPPCKVSGPLTPDAPPMSFYPPSPIPSNSYTHGARFCCHVSCGCS